MPQKIAIYEAYSNSFYGNSRYILALVKGFSGSCYQPVLIEPQSGELRSQIDAEGGAAVCVSPPVVLRTFGRKLISAGWYRKAIAVFAIIWHTPRLASTMRSQRINILQCHNLRSALTAGWAAKLLGIPMLLYIKGDLENARLAKVAFRLADVVLFQSDVNIANVPVSVREQFASKFAILPNAVDLDELERAEKRCRTNDFDTLKTTPGTVKIGFLGTLCPRKGIDILLKTAAELKSRRVAFRLYIVGDHGVNEYVDYAENMRSLCAELNLEDHVVFLGWRSDALEVLSLMDLYVLTSRSEGVPKSILEAMALGKPVISTDVGGVRSIVEDGITGFVTKSEDVHGLADAIHQLCKDPMLTHEMGKRGKQLIYQHYSLSEHIKKLFNVYTAILAARR